jgi:hypothetical protein
MTARPILLSTIALLALGCRAPRTIEVVTHPPGALVVLDQKVLGISPVEIEFWHYGARRVTVSKEGYRTQSREVEVVPPWYGRFPLDIVSEVFLPVGWTDHHVIEMDLVPGLDAITAPDIRSVLDRAEVLRRAGPEGPRFLPPSRETSLGRPGRPEAAERESNLPDPAPSTEGGE